jgi:guanylate kinase
MSNNSIKEGIRSGQRQRGRLFVVSGPSGVGKTTLIKRFLMKDKQATFSVSYTTRPPRRGEVHGRDYYFISEDKFKEMIKAGEFLEWENVHGHLYGTPKREVKMLLDSGRDVILDLDVNGAISVKKAFPDALTIFIMPPSIDELIKRLSIRGEEEIALRIKRAREEIEKGMDFDYTIVNENLKKSLEELKRIILSERGRQDGKDNR